MDALTALSVLPDRMLAPRVRAEYLRQEARDRAETNRSRRASAATGLRGGTIIIRVSHASLVASAEFARQVKATRARTRRQERTERVRARIDRAAELRQLAGTIRMGEVD